MKNKITFTSDYSFTNKNYSIETEKNNSFSIQEINLILANLNQDKIKTVKEFYRSFFSCLFFDSHDITNVLSDNMKINYLDYLKSKLKNSDIFLCDYFKSTFLVREKLLKDIQHLFLDEEMLSLPTYKHDTKTGRSRIISGTNYLTMKKEKRNMLKTHSDRFLYEIDFSSCEPMFYFQFLGVDINNIDIYEKIKNELSINIDRKKLKLSIISILYGAGYETVRRNAKINMSEYNQIKSYMQLDKFLNKIESDNGVTFNFYGRPLLGTNEKNIINHWVQSSVADFVYLAFYRYSNMFKTFNFHAIIHDAMLFSTLKFEKEKVFQTLFLTEPISNFKIPVKIQSY